jgi:nitronate monooxygenase
MRRAISHFPVPRVGDEVVRRFFSPAGRAHGAPYKLLPMYKQRVSIARQQVTIVANFVEVWLAKQGHGGPVGINLLTKVQLPNLASLYGAMLAGVDVVLMGAGIPREIPGALDALAEHRPATLRFDIDGTDRDAPAFLDFEPAAHWPTGCALPPLRRPDFLAIVSSASLAISLARKANGHVDGFVVEGATAGGHNAQPRGELRLNERGEPIYGERDLADLGKMRELGLPFWLAGGMGSPERLSSAIAAGAAGIQVGTLFAYCEQSGIDPELRDRVVRAVTAGEATLRTDPRASPTGYPFKIVELPCDAERAAARERVCDLGYLRVAVRTPEGRTVYRCAAEPVDAYVAKGGDAADTIGRRCLCNGLTATIGQAQEREGPATTEPPLVTSGDDLLEMASFIASHPAYTAEQVVTYLTN